MENQMDLVLEMLKSDLGIGHTKRDGYLINFITAQQGDLARKGIIIDLSSVEDVMLLSDYAAWHYRTRSEDVPLCKPLEYRIRNRQMRLRSEKEVNP